MRRYVAELDVPLQGAVDVEHAVALATAGHATKGMFFARLADRLRDEWGDVEATLEAPPRNGRYLTFGDYPSRDHVRLVHAAAKKAYPQLPEREAHRRLGRLGLDDFRGSRVGAVLLAMVADAEQALLRYPTAWRTSVRTPTDVTAVSTARGVCVRFRGTPIMEPEYVLGTIEALTRHYGRTPRTHVTYDDWNAELDVELT